MVCMFFHWLIKLRVIMLRFLHFVLPQQFILALFLSSIPLQRHTTISFPFIYWNLRIFYSLDVWLTTCMKTHVQVFIWTYTFFWGQKPRNRVARPSSRCIFHFLRNCQPVCQGGCATSRPPVLGAFPSPHPHRDWGSSFHLRQSSCIECYIVAD